MSTPTIAINAPAHVHHTRLLAWVQDMANLTQAAHVHWCDGSQAEYDLLCEQMVASGTMKRLNPSKRPNSFLACSDPSDVARVEDRTFICSDKKEDAGHLKPFVCWLNGWSHLVCCAIFYGSAGLTHCAHRR